MTDRDDIYRTAHPMLVDFTFDERVAAVFPDMIRRSVPGYGEILTQLGLFAERYAQPDSTLYDLGCSLGAATLALRRHARAPGCRIVAVDNAPAMVQRVRAALAADPDPDPVPVEVVCADLRDVPIQDASVVVLNFTLQFVPVTERPALLRRIRNGMRRGGVLVASEKVVAADAEEQAFQEGMQLAFKRANGYSELEISQKRTALEKVLVPETVETHLARLREAGFASGWTWFRSFNFVSIAAVA
jgi:tRNA (cmo5U34)-methyltransferase